MQHKEDLSKSGNRNIVVVDRGRNMVKFRGHRYSLDRVHDLVQEIVASSYTRVPEGHVSPVMTTIASANMPLALVVGVIDNMSAFEVDACLNSYRIQPLRIRNLPADDELEPIVYLKDQRGMVWRAERPREASSLPLFRKATALLQALENPESQNTSLDTVRLIGFVTEALHRNAESDAEYLYDKQQLRRKVQLAYRAVRQR